MDADEEGAILSKPVGDSPDSPEPDTQSILDGEPTEKKALPKASDEEEDSKERETFNSTSRRDFVESGKLAKKPKVKNPPLKVPKNVALVMESKNDDEPAFPFDYNTIHPFEEQGMPEFFQCGKDGKFKNVKLVGKTPDRYVHMRNHIVKLWEKFKVENKYLSRSAARPGLKGDVHAISRVHEFLERSGIINLGLAERRQKISPVKTTDEEDIVVARNLAKVDRSEVNEGRRITHGPNGEIEIDETQSELKLQEEEMKKMLAKNAKYFADEELEKIDPTLLKRKRRQVSRQYFYGDDTDAADAMDPFRLIALNDFADGKRGENSLSSAPFLIVVKPFVQHILIVLCVKAVMDFHSHMSMTEIIGLLGGSYDADKRKLQVEDIFPCRSNGTGIQCEMDPESEVQAHTYFAERSLSVVGWYHSHPTFDTNPSVRDIETQTNHQRLFLRHEDNVEPFVGAIVSPYDLRRAGNISTISWMCVGEQLNKAKSFRLPYRCNVVLEEASGSKEILSKKIKDLIREYEHHPLRLDLKEMYRSSQNVTRLDKLMDSLTAYLGSLATESEDGGVTLIEKLRMGVATSNLCSDIERSQDM
ncbi:Myb-like, SWIRM and MPN domains 1 [Dinochytrium kinnereticum]|nr:Myb-like, SWIRM and MPN domains 1 [Dinochytrium kinnereticum]